MKIGPYTKYFGDFGNNQNNKFYNQPTTIAYLGSKQ